LLESGPPFDPEQITGLDRHEVFLTSKEAVFVHVPDPIIDSTDGSNPEHDALLADSVGLALLIVLETLTPGSRSSCTTCLGCRSRRSPRS
jgi:hypothetical protein